MTRTGVAVLDFNSDFNPSKKNKLRDGLSGVVQIGNTLWVANDEAASLERLTHHGRNADGVHRYGDHVQFALNDFLRLPVPPPPDAKDLAESGGTLLANLLIEILSFHNSKIASNVPDGVPWLP